MFDTTAVNTGSHQGIITRTEQYLGKNLLLLACRHHIFELCCRAACQLVYESTQSPEEKIFSSLQPCWESLVKDNFEILNVTNLPRLLARKVDEIRQFCKNFVLQHVDSVHFRKDYKELLFLASVYLGGSLPSYHTFTFSAPGAVSHARWMSKIIYTLKLAMFSTQLVGLHVIDEVMANKIKQLATFLAIYHVKPWLTCTDPSNAPYFDLLLVKILDHDLTSLSGISNSQTDMITSFIQVHQSKLANHFWYLSERWSLCPFSSQMFMCREKINGEGDDEVF